MLVIVSWNVNSIRTREDHVLKLINDIKPDILMIQEIKCMDIEFPDFYSNAGYNAFICGEKGKYGVATLIKKEFDVEEVTINNQILKKEARLIMTKIKDLNLNLINGYTPNGNPIENSEKFNFKIEWMNQLKQLSCKFVKDYQKCVIGGDFNVIENNNDASNFENWRNDALGHHLVRTKFRELLSIGYLNTIRLFEKPGSKYSFWDYQRASWERNEGILIDHFLISPNLTKNIFKFRIEEKYRGLKQPSDHVPVWIGLNN